MQSTMTSTSMFMPDTKERSYLCELLWFTFYVMLVAVLVVVVVSISISSICNSSSDTHLVVLDQD